MGILRTCVAVCAVLVVTTPAVAQEKPGAGRVKVVVMRACEPLRPVRLGRGGGFTGP